jgi:hypothetical protein
VVKDGVSECARNLVESSWAESTKNSYNSYIKRWTEYCAWKGISASQASVTEGVNYLSHLFEQGEKYGYIAGTRSALSAILPTEDGKSFGNQELVQRTLKGIYKVRPSFPRYLVIYDANIVLDYMRSLPSNKDLSLEVHTKKLVTLLCLLSGSRAQVVPALDLNNVFIDPSFRYVFNIRQLIKTSKPGRHIAPLEFRSFPHEKKLCIIDCLDAYITRTASIRSDPVPKRTCLVPKRACLVPKRASKPTKPSTPPKPLIVRYTTPFSPVGKATIARYVKDFLGDAGIDVTVFTAHSTRSASTSLGSNMGMSFKDIANAAGWWQESTFQKYYNKPIVTNLGCNVLRSNIKL